MAIKSIILFFIISPIFAGVVSTAPAITELIYELGRGKELIGVSTYCNFPKEAQNLPKVGTPFTPNYEVLLRLKPDLVITQSLEEGRFEKRVKELGIKTLGIKLTSYTDIKKGIKILKNELSVEKESILERLEKKEEMLKSLKRKGSFAISIGTQESGRYAKDFMLGGDDTYLAEIIKFSGLKNVVGDVSGYKNFSIETLLKKSPDYLFLFTQGNSGEFDKVKESFQKLQSNHKTRIIVIDKTYALVPSSRVELVMSDIYVNLGK